MAEALVGKLMLLRFSCLCRVASSIETSRGNAVTTMEQVDTRPGAPRRYKLLSHKPSMFPPLRKLQCVRPGHDWQYPCISRGRTKGVNANYSSLSGGHLASHLYSRLVSSLRNTPSYQCWILTFFGALAFVNPYYMFILNSKAFKRGRRLSRLTPVNSLLLHFAGGGDCWRVWACMRSPLGQERVVVSAAMHLLNSTLHNRLQ